MKAPSTTLFLSLALVASTGLADAQDSRPAKPAEKPASQPTSKPAAKKKGLPALGNPAGVYGDGVALDKGVRLADAAKKLREFHGRPLRVQGKLDDVCRKKGCWMVLNDRGTKVRVKFRNYSFFVPRDASGREAIVQGIVSEKTISEEVAKHYAEEGGNPEEAKKIKGPQKVLAFTATGVEILGKRTLPPKASPATMEASAKLVAKIQAGKVVAKAAPKGQQAGLEAALRRLRAVKGPRTVEFALCGEVQADGKVVSVFGTTKRPFQSGYAVLKDGSVVKF